MSTQIKISKACEKANHVCDKTQYKEATLWEKIKLNFHLLYCRACRKYTSKNQKLTQVVKSADVVCMDKKEKAVLKKTLSKAIKEQQH